MLKCKWCQEEVNFVRSLDTTYCFECRLDDCYEEDDENEEEKEEYLNEIEGDADAFVVK